MGRLIAIEGGDGSGKATQARLLAQYARDLGYEVLEVSYPRYGEESAYYVEQYLNGKYGSLHDVPAELGSLPYALDRAAAKTDVIEHLKKPKSIVISDRSAASNLAHQGAKIDDTAERHEFYRRSLLTEYEVLGVPRPDFNIVLLVPSAIAQANIDKKDARTYTSQKRDIHEADASHLERAKANYEEICRMYPEEFKAIVCTKKGKMFAIEDIQQSIRHLVNLEK